MLSLLSLCFLLYLQNFMIFVFGLFLIILKLALSFHVSENNFYHDLNNVYREKLLKHEIYQTLLDATLQVTCGHMSSSNSTVSSENISSSFVPAEQRALLAYLIANLSKSTKQHFVLNFKCLVIVFIFYFRLKLAQDSLDDNRQDLVFQGIFLLLKALSPGQTNDISHHLNVLRSNLCLKPSS